MFDAVRWVRTNYFNFSGRATRSEYWRSVLFCISVFCVFGLFVPVAALLFVLAAFIPSCSVLVRRLHDTGHSGWWFFVWLVPVAGVWLLLSLLIQKSDRGDNAFGSAPTA